MAFHWNEIGWFLIMENIDQFLVLGTKSSHRQSKIKSPIEWYVLTKNYSESQSLEWKSILNPNQLSVCEEVWVCRRFLKVVEVLRPILSGPIKRPLPLNRTKELARWTRMEILDTASFSQLSSQHLSRLSLVWRKIQKFWGKTSACSKHNCRKYWTSINSDMRTKL